MTELENCAALIDTANVNDTRPYCFCNHTHVNLTPINEQEKLV